MRSLEWTIIRYFTIRNGVKQGAVLSPILYCLYIDDLYKILRNRKTGCWISGSFVGILGYADDLTLLSPTIDGLQEMVKTCEEYATEHNLSFSTHPEANRCKTKCLAFLKKDRQLKKITLCKMICRGKIQHDILGAKLVAASEVWRMT